MADIVDFRKFKDDKEVKDLRNNVGNNVADAFNAQNKYEKEAKKQFEIISNQVDEIMNFAIPGFSTIYNLSREMSKEPYFDLTDNYRMRQLELSQKEIDVIEMIIYYWPEVEQRCNQAMNLIKEFSDGWKAMEGNDYYAPLDTVRKAGYKYNEIKNSSSSIDRLVKYYSKYKELKG